MSTPAESDTQKPDTTFESQVNDVIKRVTKKEDGSWILPEGEHSEEIQYAVRVEKRRRDTQSAYVRNKQELVKSNSERDAFKNQLVKRVKANLTPEQSTHLGELKITDPDKWRQELEVIEDQAKTELETEFVEISANSQKTSEIELRKTTLAGYIEANPGFSLNDDDIPPRIAKKLESGTITFEEFLSEVHTYLKSPTVITTENVNDEPNLGQMPGSSRVPDKAAEKDIDLKYAKTDVF